MKTLAAVVSMMMPAVLLACTSGDKPEPADEVVHGNAVVSVDDPPEASDLAPEVGTKPEPEPAPPATAPTEVPRIARIRKVKTGSLPKGVVVSPDGSSLFVTNFGRIKSWNVFGYNRATLTKIGAVQFNGNGVELAYSPDGTRLYVSNFRKHKVMEIDPSKMEVVRTFVVGKNPKTLVVSPDGGRVYVSNWTSDDITVIDVNAGEVIGHVHTGNQPRGIDVSPDGKWVYVSNCAGQTVSLVDTQKLETIKTVKLKKSGKTNPRHVVVSPDGSLVYVTAQSVGFLYALDAVTMQVVAKARTGSGPKSVDITPDGLFAFTANFTGDSITAINLSTYESKTTNEPLVRAPCGLAVAPEGDRFWVTGWHTRWLGEYSITLP